MKRYLRMRLVFLVIFGMFILNVVHSVISSVEEVPKWYGVIGSEDMITSLKVNAIYQAVDLYCQEEAAKKCVTRSCYSGLLPPCSQVTGDCCYYDGSNLICDPICLTQKDSYCINCIKETNPNCYNEEYYSCKNNSDQLISQKIKDDCLKNLYPFYEGFSSCNDRLNIYYMAKLNDEIERDYESLSSITLDRNNPLKLLVSSEFLEQAPWNPYGKFVLKVGKNVIYDGVYNRYFDIEVPVGNVTLEYDYYDPDYKCVARCVGSCLDPSVCKPLPSSCENNMTVYPTLDECFQNCKCDCFCRFPGQSGQPGQQFSVNERIQNILFPIFKDIVYSALPGESEGVCHGESECYEVVGRLYQSKLSIKYYAIPCDSSSDCPGNSFCIKEGDLKSTTPMSIEVSRKIQGYQLNIFNPIFDTKSYNLPLRLSSGFCNYDPHTGKVIGLDTKTVGIVLSYDGVFLASDVIIYSDGSYQLSSREDYLHVLHNSPIFGKYLEYGCIRGTSPKPSPLGGDIYGCCYSDECWSGNECVPIGTILNVNGTNYYCISGAYWVALGSCYDEYGIKCPADEPYYIETTGTCYSRSDFLSIAGNYVNDTCYSSIIPTGMQAACIKGKVSEDNLNNLYDCCPDNTCSYNGGCYPVGSFVNHTDGRNYICWPDFLWKDPDTDRNICEAMGYNYSTSTDWCFKKDPSTGAYYCSFQSDYSPPEVDIPSCCGDDPGESWSCSPLDPDDCGCVPEGYCYYNNRVYPPGSGFYERYFVNLTNRSLKYWKCVDGEWKVADLDVDSFSCSPTGVPLLNSTIGESIIPGYVVNITADGLFNVTLGSLFNYKGSDNLSVGIFVTKNAKIHSIIPIPVEGIGKDVLVRWSFVAYDYNQGRCCGDTANESLGSRVCVPSDERLPYLTCTTFPFDYACLDLGKDIGLGCNETCSRVHLGEECIQECLKYKNSTPGILECVYNNRTYPPGSFRSEERIVSYGLNNISVPIKGYYFMYSFLKDVISDNPYITGVPIYRGNVTFVYDKDRGTLRLSFSEKRKYPIVCVNGIWYGSCGNGYCESYLGENSKTCPEDCCMANCVDNATGEMSPYCVGFKGCSIPRNCVRKTSTCVIKINTSDPINDSYCDGNVCTWVNYSGFNVIEHGAVYDCRYGRIEDCGEKAIGATIAKYFQYSPYSSLLDWNKIKSAVTVNTTCREGGKIAYCYIMGGSIDSDTIKELCGVLKGVWLEDNDYCKKRYWVLGLNSCCCGDDIGEIPYEEKYIDFLGRLNTGRMYCATNPLFCYLELGNGTFKRVLNGYTVNISVSSNSPGCNLTRYFESAFLYLISPEEDKETYWRVYQEELEKCSPNANYTVRIGQDIYDLKDEIYIRMGEYINKSTLFNATLFPGVYKCEDGYFILVNTSIPINVSEITLRSIGYPIKLSYGVNYTYDLGLGGGDLLGRLEYYKTYTQDEVSSWR